MRYYYYTHGICELTHESPNDLNTKYQESLKTSQNNSLVLSVPAKMKILLILPTSPVVCFFAWKLELVLHFL